MYREPCPGEPAHRSPSASRAALRHTSQYNHLPRIVKAPSGDGRVKKIRSLLVMPSLAVAARNPKILHRITTVDVQLLPRDVVAVGREKGPALAIFSGDANRPSGVFALIWAAISSGMASIISVEVNPGAMELAVMLNLLSAGLEPNPRSAGSPPGGAVRAHPGLEFSQCRQCGWSR